MTLLRSILHQAARCAIAIASFGCDQVLGVEEAHVDPTVQAAADANGGATNVAEKLDRRHEPNDIESRRTRRSQRRGRRCP